jgi:tetratricopeptide (TPR) repeat protein
LAVTRDNFVAHHNLGYVLLLQQNYDEAASQTEEALRLHPDLIEAEYQLGFIKDQQHKFAEAIPYYQKALELKWDWAMAHRALLNACYQAGQTNLAVIHLEKLVRSAPDNPGGHLELAQALQAANRLPEALAQYRDAIRLAPRWSAPLNDLAWLLATSHQAEIRNGSEAVALAKKACELADWKQPQIVGTLAAAFAENGDFAQAVETAQRATQIAQSIGQKEIAERNEKLLELYKDKKPYRDVGQW